VNISLRVYYNDTAGACSLHYSPTDRHFGFCAQPPLQIDLPVISLAIDSGGSALCNMQQEAQLLLW